MRISRLSLALAVAPITLWASSLGATPVAATDLADLSLGATIVGPVGPTVDTSLVTAAGESLGDLSSRVACPSGFTACVPPENPSGTVYTYIHEVTPGVDAPNDGPFPNPDTVRSPSDLAQFSLTFPPSGFTGVAGFSFAEAEAVLDGGAGAIAIEELPDGLNWEVAPGSGWDSGEQLTFFWQTVLSPSGPGGQYQLSNRVPVGTGAGPIPAAPATDVPEPASGVLLLIGGLMVVAGFARSRLRHWGGTIALRQRQTRSGALETRVQYAVLGGHAVFGGHRYL